MTGTRAGSDAASLLKAVRDRDPLAIARAITAIENRTAVGTELAVAVRGRASRCRTLGVTGPPGAGKSSLINALLPELLPRYRRVAILTVDPSSPISGGAVLGDRVRMAAHSANPDVFIRSLAARGHLGGVTRTTRSVMDLLAAADMDLVIVETVGTGQSEVEVANLTDVKIVVCAPGLGDEMQAMKAGVLEIADLLVVNKADLPDAARTATHLKAMLHHRGHEERRSMLSVSTQTRDGLKALGDAIDDRFAGLPAGPPDAAAGGGISRSTLAQDVADAAAALLLGTSDPRLTTIVEHMSQGKLSRHEGAKAALELLTDLDAPSEARIYS
ncbi:MAG TPA: methylmalonyl Co-A mutase-associated GTPase MeaB [Sphingopyxis sp.]|mgnify:CR=1 FL=1|uniref:methylmalonyl Co-A mutase-associated GTPase MeaB n=1 Tax=Sphingopyxis sp. TaxID=1908224 RepID=UPI002E10B01E|nr:methylmalonyl Co-A mutase-associated GTPase MeaB [Sphingopyxis sp.]